MLRIPCPYCGERDHTEFVYGGDADAWPDPLDEDGADGRDRYRRANPAGPHAELWQHALGCRQWLRVVRDTADHRVLSAEGPDRETARPGGR